MELRMCRGECGQTKPLEEFSKYKRDSDVRRKRCRDCHRIYKRSLSSSSREWKCTRLDGESIPRVPVGPIRPYVLEKMRELGASNVMFSKITGVDDSLISRIIRGDSGSVSSDIVDRILVSFEDTWLMPDLYPELYGFIHDDLLDSLTSHMTGATWLAPYRTSRAEEKAMQRAVRDLLEGGWIAVEKLTPPRSPVYTKLRAEPFDATEFLG